MPAAGRGLASLLYRRPGKKRRALGTKCASSTPLGANPGKRSPQSHVCNSNPAGTRARSVGGNAPCPLRLSYLLPRFNIPCSGRQNGFGSFVTLIDATCATLDVLALSVTAGMDVWKPFCRAGRPTERDLRKPFEFSHSFVMQGGVLRGVIMYPPPYPPVGGFKLGCAFEPHPLSDKSPALHCKTCT